MLQPLTPQQVQDVAAARSARRAVARLAREDASVFNQFVLRDERTGKRIKQAPMHRQWHRLIDMHQRLVFWAHVDAGKTQQVSVGRILWELGRNPNLRTVVITKTSDLAQKIVRSAGQYIEKSDALREVFPDLRPSSDPSLPWTSQKLTVERQVFAKEASVQASGVFGNILGTRIDLLVLDDVIDAENTRTATPREHLWNWVRATLFGRLSEEARVVVMGNAWHPEDLLHRLGREPRFKAYRFPVQNAAGELTWPDHWSEDRIAKARLDMGPLEFSRALLCQARDDETARFKREWIERCTLRGKGLSLLHTAGDLLEEVARGQYGTFGIQDFDGAVTEERAADAARRLGDSEREGPIAVRFYTGVDLAVQAHAAADLTCIFTIAVLPNGDRRIMAVESGRWAAPEILKRIVDHHQRYGSICVVENNAAQDYLVQMLREHTAVPVRGFTTGKQKASPEFGVESLAAEFANGKWIIPSGPNGTERGKELDAWVTELVHYEPPPAHTGDRLMACWFAREGARPGEGRGGVVGVRVFGG